MECLAFVLKPQICLAKESYILEDGVFFSQVLMSRFISFSILLLERNLGHCIPL